MNLNIEIPYIDESFYTPVKAKQNEDKIVNIIRPKYGKLISNTSSLTGVPTVLLESFIFIESGGNEKAKSPYAVGLMQLNGATASDAIVKEKGMGRLRDGEAAILKKYLGSRYSNVDKVKKNQKTSSKTFVTNDDLFKPEFNVLVGSILLKQLLDEFSVNGDLRLDKVITIYNGGRYSKAAKKVIQFKGTPNQMLTQVPKETSNYILKLLGTHGILDTIV
jgi:soluble lytic murein transglycosylase-like protein